MADKDQRTEDATPKRQAKLREDGKVAKSGDIGTAATLAAATAVIAATGTNLANLVSGFAVRSFRLSDFGQPLMGISSIETVLVGGVLPIIVTVGIVGAVVGITQTRGLFSLSLIAPKFDKLNPIPNLKNVLPSKQSAAELGKSLLKISLVGLVVYDSVISATPQFVLLATVQPVVAVADIASVAGGLFLRAIIAFSAIAALDYFLARRKFTEESKMSKQEVKDEHKQQEGDPQIRAKVRGKMREAAKRRSSMDVSQATVLVTNPTHLSVALRYDPEIDPAPVVLAMGADERALEMRTAARHKRIPIVENRALARALYAESQAGQVIPIDLYKAAAEVIGHVMRLKSGGLA